MSESQTMTVVRIGERCSGKHVGVPNELIGKAAPDSLLVLGWLVGHSDNYRGSVSEATIAKVFGIGNKRAARIIDDLEQAGFCATIQQRIGGELKWMRLATLFPDELAIQIEHGVILGVSEVKLKRQPDGSYSQVGVAGGHRPHRKTRRDPPQNAVTPTAKRGDSKEYKPSYKQDNKPSSLDATASLSDLVTMWNLLESQGLVHGKHNPDKLAPGVEKSYDKLTRHPSLKHIRKALGDLNAVYAKIAAAEGLRKDGKPKTWFTLKKLLSETGASGEHVAIMLMDGSYDREFNHTTGTGTNGTSKGSRNGRHGGTVQPQAGRIRSRDFDPEIEKC